MNILCIFKILFLVIQRRQLLKCTIFSNRTTDITTHLWKAETFIFHGPVYLF